MYSLRPFLASSLCALEVPGLHKIVIRSLHENWLEFVHDLQMIIGIVLQ